MLKTTQHYCTNIAVVPNPNKGKKKGEGLLAALALRLAEVWLFTTYRWFVGVRFEGVMRT